MGKIGDLWVRLGLKSDDYKKGIKDANKQTEGFGSKLGKMKAGAIAVWAAVGAAVTKFAKDLIASTNRMGDAWATFTSRSKAAWDTFLSSVSSWNFNDFFARMKQATAEAAEFAKAMDSEFEVGNSIKLQRSAMAAELAALKVQMQDATKTFDERIKAAKTYIEKVTPLYAQIEAQAKRMEDAHLGKWLAGSGLQDTDQVRKDLRRFIVEIGQNIELYDQLSALSDAQRTIDKGVNAWGSNYAKVNAARTDRAKLLSQLSGVIGSYDTDLLSLFRAYNDMRGDKDTAPLIEAMVAADEAAAMLNRDTAEMQSVMNGLINQRAVALVKALAMQSVEEPSQMFADLKEQMKADLQEIEDLDMDVDLDLGLEDIDQEIKDFLAKWQQDMQQIEALNGMLENSIISATQNGMQALTDMMFGLEGADMKQVMAAFLSPFADTLKQMGSMIMAEGIAMEAFKKSFTNPYAAIAAGAALIAIGSAVSSGLQALTANPTGGAGTSASYGGNSYGSGTENYESTLNIEVTGKISGSDILIAGRKQQSKWDR